MKNIITTCTRDCPGSCTIQVLLEQGTIKKLKGSGENPFTAGFLCPSTSNFLRNRFYSSHRILHPLKKVKGSWKRINWDEALDLAAKHLKETAEKYGSTSILYYQGFGARTALRILNLRFFNLMGGVSTLKGTLCGGTGQAGQEMDMGIRISHDPMDHLNSNCIIIWGRNPAHSDIHLWRILRKAQKKGSILVVIDPIKTTSAHQSDLFLQIKPGTDPYLGLALAKIFLQEEIQAEEFIKNNTHKFSKFKKLVDKYSLDELCRLCDLEIEDVSNLAGLYAQKPSSIIAGWGVHRYYQGHLSLRMMDALCAISGNLGISGGGVSQGFDELGFFDHKWAGNKLTTNQRKLSMPIIGEEILRAQKPPIKLIFLTAGNPLAMAPNSHKVKKAFKSVDYFIVADQILNDSSQEADLFLPTTTFLEEKDLVGSYGHNYISPLNPVLKPLGESRSELWIFQQLAKRLGFLKEMSGTPDEWIEKIAQPLSNQGINLEELQKKPMRVPQAPFTPYNDHKFFNDSGKFEFVNKIPILITKNEDYPFYLLSTIPQEWVGSEIPESEHKKGYLTVNIHPETMKNYQLQNGEMILLQSTISELKVEAYSSKNVRKDTILTYRGGWVKYNKGVNILTEDMVSKEGEGTPYYETRVRIKKLA
ncbi:MAG: molybdopterin-dependent oxidoreductase [Methanobacteriaceae archaeon]|nr:molybdopterin-dependent oxidoreductase [Methanobacteriaceae archaeon]